MSRPGERLESVLDGGDFAETVDAIVLGEPRFTATFFPLFTAVFALLLAWAAFLPMDERVYARGEIRVAGDVLRVHAGIEGLISALLVAEGELVEKNAPLFRLDAADAEMRLAKLGGDLDAAGQAVDLLERQREALRARARVERGRLERERERQAALLTSGLVSGRVVEELDAELAGLDGRHRQEGLELDTRLLAARQERDGLRRGHDEARLGLERHTLRAPAAGVVSRLEIRTPGQAVARDTLLAEITPRERPLEMSAEIRLADIARVRPGLPARVKLDPYPFREWGMVDARLDYIAPDRRDAGYEVRLRLTPPADGRMRFKPGMPGTAEILTERVRVYQYLIRKMGLKRARPAAQASNSMPSIHTGEPQ